MKQRAERYEILGEHGRGGLGRVSRARDRELGRDVAIKELIARGEVSEARFRREALITARLEHPGIVPLYEAGQWADGTPYYAMKLVAGRPLRALIAERETVAARLELLHHVIAVADAIAYAHGRGVIHRDLKPANVIVGEFGETVVIDWGLAKDLNASDEGLDAPGGETASSDRELTTTGMVLGTPAYMAPEQERGEAVDQRADVFAIGAMLWELCALTKVPPTERRQRHRLLRANGIDIDLIAIVEKCLEPQPGRRYEDAAGLAADLRAFKAGARIAARSYTLSAMLGHWARRNRRATGAAMAVMALAIVGVGLYVRNLSAERRRVEAGEQRLILENARALMTRDPTAAADLLASYRGDSPMAAAMLEAEARGRSVAALRLPPASGATALLGRFPGGVVTLTAGFAVAKVFVNGSRRNLHIEPGMWWLPFYSEKRNVMLYLCVSGRVCLYDVIAERQIALPEDPAIHDVVSMDITDDGRVISSKSRDNHVVVMRLSDTAVLEIVWSASLPWAYGPYLLPHGLMAITNERETVVGKLDAGFRKIATIEMPMVSAVALNRAGTLAVAGSKTGELAVLDLHSTTTRKLGKVCATERIARVASLGERGDIAYRCNGGGPAGVWRGADRFPTVLSTTSAFSVSSADGHYFYVGTFNGDVVVYDSYRRSTKTLSLHTGYVLGIIPPSEMSPYLISSDSRGEIRGWRLAEDPVIDALDQRPDASPNMLPLIDGSIVTYDGSYYAQYSGNATRIIGSASPNGPIQRWLTPASSMRFASYGLDARVDIWTLTQDWSRVAIDVGHRSVVVATFSRDGNSIVTASEDGALARRSVDGLHSVDLGTLPESITSGRACLDDQMLLVTARQRLWLIQRDSIHYIGTIDANVAVLSCSRNGSWFSVVSGAGTVYTVNTRTLALRVLPKEHPNTSWLAISPDGQEMAIVNGDRVTREPLQSSQPMPSWHVLDFVRPDAVTYSPDNRWMAITADYGALWFFRRTDARWVFVPLGTAAVRHGMFSANSARFFAKDATGKISVIDMTAPMFQ